MAGVRTQEELTARFGVTAFPPEGATPAPFFGAVERERKRANSLPDQDWCRTSNGHPDPPWFAVRVPEPASDRWSYRLYWGMRYRAGEFSVFADSRHRERVLRAGSWADARAALAKAHGVPLDAVESRRSLWPWVRS